MLSAERVALNSDLQARRLDIREKDLNQLTTFIDGLSTQAALLAGFAFSGLQSLPAETSAFWKILLFVSTAITLGADIYVVCVGQLTTILAPTLALNGPKGSMERAVIGMRAERGNIFRMFLLGLVGFFFEVVALLAIYLETALAGICIVIVCVFFIATVVVSQRVMNNFDFEAPELKPIIRANTELGYIEPKEAQDESRKDGFVSAQEYINMEEQKRRKVEANNTEAGTATRATKKQGKAEAVGTVARRPSIF